MGARYLADTNVVIELLGASLPISGSNWLQDILDQDLCCLSVINKIELLGFEGESTEMQHLQDFIDFIDVLPLF